MSELLPERDNIYRKVRDFLEDWKS